MKILYLVLYLVAAICFTLAVVGAKVGGRYNLVAAGLLAWLLVPTIAHIDSLDA